MMIDFTIPGKPKPLKRHRVAKYGRMYDPSHADKKEMWLQIAKYKPKSPLTGNILLKATFYMERPKNHYRTGKFKHILKEDAPIRHGIRPDLDNLLKMVVDVLQPQFIHDDSQICVILAEKEYGKPARTEVTIEEIS